MAGGRPKTALLLSDDGNRTPQPCSHGLHTDSVCVCLVTVHGLETGLSLN